MHVRLRFLFHWFSSPFSSCPFTSPPLLSGFLSSTSFPSSRFESSFFYVVPTLFDPFAGIRRSTPWSPNSANSVDVRVFGESEGEGEGMTNVGPLLVCSFVRLFVRFVSTPLTRRRLHLRRVRTGIDWAFGTFEISDVDVDVGMRPNPRFEGFESRNTPPSLTPSSLVFRFSSLKARFPFHYPPSTFLPSLLHLPAALFRSPFKHAYSLPLSHRTTTTRKSSSPMRSSTWARACVSGLPRRIWRART